MAKKDVVVLADEKCPVSKLEGDVTRVGMEVICRFPKSGAIIGLADSGILDAIRHLPGVLAVETSCSLSGVK